MQIADIDGRRYERRRQQDRREFRFAAIAAGILMSLGLAAIAWAMGHAI